MLTGMRVNAIALTRNAKTALLVADGADWNGLRKFRCVDPPDLSGQTVIAMRDPDQSPFAAMFGEIFRLADGEERWVVLMASPGLAVWIKPDGT